MSGIPILLEGAELRVLVVGGGPVAARKAARFVHAGATVHVVAPDLCDDLEELVRNGTVGVERRRYESGDVDAVELVIAATDDRAVNAGVARDARTAHRLVNVADAPNEGAFAFMAAHVTGPLTIGVSAGGIPLAATRIRDAIASRFDMRYDEPLRELVLARRTLLDAGEGHVWRERAAAVIDADFCENVESGRLRTRTASWR